MRLNYKIKKERYLRNESKRKAEGVLRVRHSEEFKEIYNDQLLKLRKQDAKCVEGEE